MKSWKARLGLVLTMLAMVLVVSIPAVADNDRDCINRDGDRFCEVNGDRDFDHGDFRHLCEDNDSDDCDLEDVDFEDLRFFDDLDFEVDDVEFVCGDNDGDGSVDEDAVDGLDNDLDGLLDEDENFFECDNPLLVAELEVD